MEKKEKNSIKKIIILVLCCIAYAGALIVQAYIGLNADVKVFNDDLTLGHFQGVVSSIMLMLVVAMVCTSRAGYFTSLCTLGLNLVIIVGKIIRINDINSIPGAAIVLAGIGIVVIIHSYLVKLSKKEQELFDIAHVDSLTSLPNRRALKNRMTEIMESDGVKNNKFAVVMLDVDNFKNINDTIGHDFGDKVLSGIAERWNDIANDNDFIARLGGDEFAMIVSDYQSLRELDDHLKELSKSIGKKFELKGTDYYVSASIGVALYPSDSTDCSQLLKYADTAMYAAKSQGKKRICYFDRMMNDLIESNVQVENVIRHAVEQDAFKLVYQPQYEAKTKILRGFEALIRLSDDKGKQVSPAQFIPVAEQSSLIMDVDRWVLKHAMSDFVGLLQKNEDIVLSINISATHMLDDSFIVDVDNIMKEVGFPAKNLELELTESVFVDSLDKARNIMKELKKRGIHIALDDFGTGYSSLSYLKELPIDLLKIDKAFVDSIKDGPKEESFVAAIISLSQLMQFAVISEGVEEEYQLKTLQNLGCDYIQGFLWGRPQMLSEAKSLLN